MKRERFVIIFLLSVIVILTFIRSFMIIDTYFLSLEYDEIQKELQETRKEQFAIKEELITVQSLQYIRSEAIKKGFVQATYIYL